MKGDSTPQEIDSPHIDQGPGYRPTSTVIKMKIVIPPDGRRITAEEKLYCDLLPWTVETSDFFCEADTTYREDGQSWQ